MVHQLSVLQEEYVTEDDNIRFAMNDAEALMTIMPSSESKRFHEELKNVDAELTILDTQTASLLVVGPALAKSTDQAALLNHVRQASALKHRVENISLGLLSSLQELEERNERLSAFFGFTSYVLIALGLGLSLTGQLVGKPEDIPDVKL